MRYRLRNGQITFEYGSQNSPQLTPLNVNEWYRKLGGQIFPNTEIEVSSYFPGEPYEYTALTRTRPMPPTYLCEGSLSISFYTPNRNTDVLSISAYRDTSDHDPTLEEHHNIYLQYEVSCIKDHTDEIPDRHIPLQEGVIIRALLNDKELKKKIIPCTQKNES